MWHNAAISNRRQFIRRSRDVLLLTSAAVLFDHATSPLKAAAGAASPSWPLFRGNPLATGVAEGRLGNELSTIWEYEVDKGGFEGTPIIWNDIVYIADLDGALHAIHLADGQAAWTKDTGSFGYAASLALHDGKFHVGDFDGVFRCFDAQGNELWKFTAQAEINASANFHRGRVLFGSQDATLYCLNADDGQLTWKVEMDDQIRCSPTVVQDRSFVAGCDGRLHIVDLQQGQEVASVPIGGPTGVTPAVQGDHVFFGTEGGDVFCIDWKQAKVVWRFQDMRRREIRSCPAVDPRMLVIGSRGKNVYGIEPRTGKLVWTLKCKRGVDSSPVIVGDRVFVADTNGEVHLLDLLSGKTIWSKETGRSFRGSPAVADNRVVIASDDGVVYCFA